MGVKLRYFGTSVVGGSGVCDYGGVEECLWEAKAGYY